MRPCLRCFAWGVATGMTLWWVFALVWEELSRVEALAVELDDDTPIGRHDCFRELPSHVSTRL